MERKRQIHSILSLRQRDPPGLEKGDPTKPYSYNTIEQMCALSEMHDFLNVQKKIYDIENSNLNQLDLPVNHMTFIFVTTLYFPKAL